MSEVPPPGDFGDALGVDSASADVAGSAADSSAPSGLAGRLLETEEPADLTVRDLERNGMSSGLAHVAYGFVMAAGASGLPAVGYIVLGSFLELNVRASASGEGEARSSRSAGEGEASSAGDGPAPSNVATLAEGPPQERGPAS